MIASSKLNNNNNKYSRKFNKTSIIIAIVLLAVGIIIFTNLLYFKFITDNELEIKNSESIYLKNLIGQINANLTARWKAKYNPFGIKNKSFNYKTLKNVTAVKYYVDQIKKFFQTEKMTAHLQSVAEFPEKNLPRNFDARVKWSDCPTLHSIPNQGGCGSCYAIAAMSVASDRSCIQSNGTLKNELSAEDVLGCCAVCGNCLNGGDPLKALAYWALEGVVTGGHDGCRSYSIKSDCGTPCSPAVYPLGESLRKCVRKCQNGYYKNAYENDKQFGSIAYTLYPRKMTMDQAGKERITIPSIIGHFNQTAPKPLNITQIHHIIQKELYLYGPTTFAFPVTEEFLHYESGIFHPLPEENFEKRIVFWHVVKLIGWGYDKKDRLYWIAINSFGNQWGENGAFRIDPTMIEKFGLEYESGLL